MRDWVAEEGFDIHCESAYLSACDWVYRDLRTVLQTLLPEHGGAAVRGTPRPLKMTHDKERPAWLARRARHSGWYECWVHTVSASNTREIAKSLSSVSYDALSRAYETVHEQLAQPVDMETGKSSVPELEFYRGQIGELSRFYSDAASMGHAVLIHSC